MKRNKTTNRVKKSGLSPYSRHGKRPYVYSPAYEQWRASVTRSRPADPTKHPGRGRVAEARRNRNDRWKSRLDGTNS